MSCCRIEGETDAVIHCIIKSSSLFNLGQTPKNYTSGRPFSYLAAHMLHLFLCSQRWSVIHSNSDLVSITDSCFKCFLLCLDYEKTKITTSSPVVLFIMEINTSAFKFLSPLSSLVAHLHDKLGLPQTLQVEGTINKRSHKAISEWPLITKNSHLRCEQ